MSTKSKAKGTAAEREVVRYLQNWWPAAERRALSGNKDKGDVAGIAGLVVEVKAAKQVLLAAWQRETLIEMQNAGASACMLVVKVPMKAVNRWAAWVPVDQVSRELGAVELGGVTWVRMDLPLAAALFRLMGY